MPPGYEPHESPGYRPRPTPGYEPHETPGYGQRPQPGYGSHEPTTALDAPGSSGTEAQQTSVFGAHEAPGYSAQETSVFGAHETSGYGTQETSVFGARETPGYGEQQTSVFGAHEGSGYGAQETSVFGAREGSGYGARDSSGPGRQEFPEYGDENYLWDQPTQVFEPIRDAPAAAPGDGSGGKRSGAVRYALMGLAVVLVGVLAVGGFFAARHFGSSAVDAEAVVTTTPRAAVTTSAAPAGPSAPVAGAPLASVAAWVKAGKQIDSSKFHSATSESDGKTNNLGSGVAFVSPSGKIQCMTPKGGPRGKEGLACLVNWDNPPQRPAALAKGNWVASWVDFPGETLGIGKNAGDPGQFLLGKGDTLTYGSRVTFDDYDCRMEESGLVCVNEKASTAIQLNSAGAMVFGCLGETTSKEYGKAYSCGGVTTTTSAAPTVIKAGDKCTKAGETGYSANLTPLTCDTAGDSGLRWQDLNPISAGAPCSAEQVGYFGYTADGTRVLCTRTQRTDASAWSVPNQRVASGQHEVGESCNPKEDKLGATADGKAVYCKAANGSPTATSGEWKASA
ncbi:hypothetical protein [Nocardia yamanashiensis]|uniref:hypothetical protein n=1 Tax=Nocardia yamanashiensis TaxID=209247 RepID=UPI000AA372CA|nr:hypothetical protein [Nocardia yamanashiensis]